MYATIKLELLANPQFIEYEKELSKIAEERDKRLVQRGVISDVISKDIRYNMGYVQAIRDILNLNEEIRRENEI